MIVTGIIFANIYDSSLRELTNKRTMGSLPYGGRYRQIDFALSNMANSGIRQIGIISRYNYQSLMHHVGSGEEWNLELEAGGLEFLTPFSMSDNASYRGKLEALSSAMDHLEYGRQSDYVVLADAGVLCNIDLNRVLESHVASGKDITVVTKAGITNGKRQMDMVVKVDQQGQVTDMAVDYAAPQGYLASTGIFVIPRTLLIQQVKETVARSLYRLERDFILRCYRAGEITVNAYQHEGVVQYNESPEEYYRNNLALIEKEIRGDLFGGCHSIYTKVRDQVPSYYGEDCHIEDSIVADGCILEGTARHSVLFRQVSLAPGALVEDCIIMNSARIGAGAEVRCAILDKDVTVRPGARLVGTPENPVIVKRGAII